MKNLNLTIDGKKVNINGSANVTSKGVGDATGGDWSAVCTDKGNATGGDNSACIGTTCEAGANSVGLEIDDSGNAKTVKVWLKREDADKVKVEIIYVD